MHDHAPFTADVLKNENSLAEISWAGKAFEKFSLLGGERDVPDCTNSR